MVLLLALFATFDDAHRQEVATANPPDLQFTLSVTDGRRQFHAGETIPITLALSNSAPNRYRLNAAVYDRSGRLLSEEFTVGRPDAIDPLALYFGSGMMGFAAGGSRSTPMLGPEPRKIELVLNDWLRFDKPGRYRIYLKSLRITLESAQQTFISPVSNILELEILPRDPAWEGGKLREIQSTSDDPKALRALVDLGTPEAVAELFARARRNSAGLQTLDSLALIRSPYREHVISALDSYLQDSAVKCDGWPVTLRAWFDYVKRYLDPLVPVKAAERSRVDMQALQATAEKRRKEFEQMQRKVAAALIPCIKQKREEVQETCVQVIAALAPDEAKSAGLLEPDDFGLTPAQLINGFSGFAEDRKLKLLSEKWALIRGPEMIPALHSLLQQLPAKTTPPILAGQLVWMGPADLSDWALYRLRQMAPAQEQELLRDDVASGRIKFAESAVRELPAQDIPQADDVLAAKLKSDAMTAISAVPLVAKFGSRALLEPMTKLYKGPSGPCMTDLWFVAYFTRVDTEKCAQVLREAMAARTDRGCYPMLLGQVARVTWNPVMRAQTLAALNDPEPAVSAEAAGLLAAHDGRASEAALWQRLELWSQQKRADERNLGEALIGGLAGLKDSILDDAKARRLATFCADDDCRKRWREYRLSPVRLSNQVGFLGSDLSFTVQSRNFADLSSAFETLARYPAGTVIELCAKVIPNEFDSQDLESARQKLDELARAKGFTIAACSSQ